MIDHAIRNLATWRARALGLTAMALLAFGFASLTAAQTSGQPGPGNMPPAAMLLQQIHVANQVQIKAAEIAKQKATNVLTRRLADRLWRDHQVADGKVKALAGKLGYQLKSPAQMQQMMQNMQPAQTGAMGGPQKMQQMHEKMQKMQQMLAKLKSTPGPQFDQVYAQTMAKSHQNMLQMLQQARTQAKPPVKKLLGVLIPILGQQEALAQLVMAPAVDSGAKEMSR